MMRGLMLLRHWFSFALGMSLVVTALSQSTPFYVAGWELLRSGRSISAAQDWAQASASASQRKTPASLKDAAFAGVLSSIAYEREGDSRAYSRWADSVRLYLEAGYSWDRHRNDLRAQWRKIEQSLALAGAEGAAGMQIEDHFLLDMVKRVNLLDYLGPKAGLAESRDGTLVSSVSPQYFAGATTADAASDITAESRYAGLSADVGRASAQQIGFVGGLPFAPGSRRDVVRDAAVTTSAQTMPAIDNVADRRTVSDRQVAGPILSSPGSSLPTVSNVLSTSNPFGRGGATPVGTTVSTVPASAANSSSPILSQASNAQLLGFSRLGSSGADSTRNTASDLGAARAQSSAALAMPRLFVTNTTNRPLSDVDRVRVARAWRYVQSNRHASTGLVNGKDSYPVASVADFSHILSAYVSALSLQLVDKETFDTDLRQTFATLQALPFYNQELFNREYDTRSGRLLDLSAKTSTIGGGWSAGDIGRLLIWLKIVANMSPDLREAAANIVARLKLGRMVSNGLLTSAYAYANGEQLIQNLRLGEEQYAAAGLALWGIVLPVSLNYNSAAIVRLGKLRIPTDIRNDAYISPEIFAKGLIELGGLDGCFERVAQDALDTQLEKGREFDSPLMVADESLDQAPWFVYGSLWGQQQFGFVASYDKQVRADLANFSVKAAYLWAAVSPGVATKSIKDFADQIESSERGLFAGRYSSGALNLALTLETNALTLESFAYLLRGRKPFLRFDNPVTFDCPALIVSK